MVILKLAFAMVLTVFAAAVVFRLLSVLMDIAGVNKFINTVLLKLFHMIRRLLKKIAARLR